ncbi:MAG: SH3 domain-containing protein [Lachnospiraceae bacterium]|nr:SH3 domain-containing protein [Lachnospiraceae bacterium]
MKKLSVILTLTLSLLLYGCGNQDVKHNGVTSVSTVKSTLHGNSDALIQAQVQYSDIVITASNDNDDFNVDNNENLNASADTAGESKSGFIKFAATNEHNVLGHTVKEYEEARLMYVINSVNIRKGPSTAYEKVGTLNSGQAVIVLGQADTNWYEIAYGANNELRGFVSNKYLKENNIETAKPTDEAFTALLQSFQAQGITLTEEQLNALIAAWESMQAAANTPVPQTPAQPATPTAPAVPETTLIPDVRNTAGLILVGDSRFVQMQESVGANYCTWIAEGGKGYTWFEEKAIPRIDNCVGNGSKILINLGVNDTRNLQKYITLVNAKAAEWTALGATVYYASVNPVWENRYVTEEQVEYFNTQMRNNLGPYVHWIDSHSYLTSVGYRLVDGLHYSPETYQVIFAYFMSCM